MTRTSTQDLQEDFLAALRKGQQTIIGALRIWVETVQAVTPKLSGVYAPLTGKLPGLPNVGVPFADQLPSPKEAVDSVYGLAEELLANQRKFAEAVLDIAAPLMPGHEQDVTNHATPKSAPKPVVIRTEPRPAEPRPAAMVPAPPRVMVKPEPTPAVVVKPEPTPAVVVKPEPTPAVVVKPELKTEAVATAPKPPVATTPEPTTPEPKAAESKAPEPKAPEPKAAPRRAATPKAAPRKAAAPKAATPKAAPKAAAPKRTPKSADAS
jgi:hypothetical protein